MLTSHAVTHAGEHPYEPEAALAHCGLFGDRVAERVCLLLKRGTQRVVELRLVLQRMLPALLAVRGRTGGRPRAATSEEACA